MRAVIKVGGTLLETASERLRIAGLVARQVRAGHQVLLVHGGGKQLTGFLETMGIASEFVDGFRVTTPETLDGVIKVFAGTVNHELLAAFYQAGLPAVGLSGIDAGSLVAEKLRGEHGQDWGFVGRIKKVNPRAWEVLLQAGFLPVVACLAVGEEGHIYNVNADQAAVACAVHLRAERLVFLTDVDGVRDGQGHALARLGAEEIPALLRSGVVTGGMLAKLNAVREALAQEVPCVHIRNGHRDDALDGVFVSGEPSREAAVAGTMITPSLTASSRDGRCGGHRSEGGYVA